MGLLTDLLGDGNGTSGAFTDGVTIEVEAAEQKVGLDISHSADQGVSANYRAAVIHNYTDADGLRVDGVGSGALLNLKNGQNATKRPDKASTYVGTGKFVSLNIHDDAAGFSRELFYINGTTGQMVWTGATATAAAGNVAKFLQNKADDGGYAFAYELTNPHVNVFNFGGVLELRNDVTNTRATLRSNTGQTNGMYITTVAGPLLIDAATVVRSNRAFRAATFTTAARPTGSNRETGVMIWDTTLGKPVWFNGTNWIDAAGTTV